MRKSFSAIAFVIFVAASSAAFGADDLFSRVSANSVFVPPSATDPSGRTPQKLLNGEQLSDALKKAGFQPEAAGDKGVSISVPRPGKAIPAIVALSDDLNQAALVMMLGEVQDEKQVPAQKLLALMEASRQHAPAYFSYSAERKRIELHLTFVNDGLTGEILKQEITRLAEIADQTQPLWELTSATPAAPSAAPKSTQNQPAAPPAAAPVQAAPPAASESPLVGKWSASRSASEGFAVHFKSDGSFVLVHVKAGKQTRSQGKFLLSGRSLTLSADDGTKLAGTATLQSAAAFQFLPQGTTAGLNFKRAK